MIDTAVEEDQEAREYLRSQFDANLFVEAGAGTGKTTEVVNRIVALISLGHTTIDKVASITFTEAAAAELRARVREGFDSAILDETRDSVERTRCSVAIDTLDNAAISTIHAFCAAILRTFPLEAGLPPMFQTLDEIEQQIEFASSFHNWFEGIGDDRSYGPICQQALLLGLTPKNLSTVAEELSDNYDLLGATTTWTARGKPDAVDLARELGHCLRQLEVTDFGQNADHGFVRALQATQFVGEQLRLANTENDALSALQLAEWIPNPRGALGAWRGDIEDGKAIKQGIKDVKEAARDAMSAHRECALVDLLPSLRDFVLTTVEDRRRRGVATFQDLLVWTRTVLRENDEARQRLQQRWSHLFVDEFQDTDPLQAEIAFYLCAQPLSGVAGNWRDASLVPGKLCVVGDPKQSIYRFRRADIAVYQAVQEAIERAGGKRVSLRRNFRSSAPIVSFVNKHFERVMVEELGAQPRYSALAASRASADACVREIGGPLTGKQVDVWTEEAEAVAQAVKHIAGRWTVDDHGLRRPANLSDVCVLIPTRTNIRRLERSFEEADIPYRLESGALILATQEIRELLACLRAIDDPSDEVALVAALRSPSYACSDNDLLRWIEAGGRFDYTPGESDKDGQVAAAFKDLSARHDARNTMSVASLIQRFLDDRLLTVAAFDSPRARETWRRQRWLTDRARAFAATGNPSLRAFVDWLEGLEKQSYRDSVGAMGESDEDAVRVMTVHGSKGLEFPIVIMTGLGSKPNPPTVCVIPDRLHNRIEVRTGSKSTPPVFATADHEAAMAREDLMEEAEQIRLAYVAATRARDHLVLSVYRKAGRDGADDGDTHARSFAMSLSTFDSVRHLALEGESIQKASARPTSTLPSAEEHRKNEQHWVDQRHEVLQSRASLPLKTATGIAHEPEDQATEDNVVTYRKGRAGTSLGRAVHAVLQSVDLESLGNVDELAAVQASAEDIPDLASRVADLVRRAQSTPSVQEALRSSRYWREVPVGARLNGYIVEGFIDLLYESDDGLVVVDYKTDDVSGSELQRRLDGYALQGAVYAALVGLVTSRRIERIDFVFAAVGQSHSFAAKELSGRLEEALAHDSAA